MAKSGPQRYPEANTSRWYQTTYGGDAMEVNTVVWHSTEGTSLDSYQSGAVAPNFTALPDFKAQRLVWYQHFDFDVSSRALVHTGAVATNTLNVVQIEVVGTCDPSTHAKWQKAGYAHLYMPDLPDWVIRGLAAFAKWAHEEHGVPLTSDVTFKAYPGSYGANGVRMSNAQWLNFSGHCGHQHVPSGNDHGDPGLFPMAAILAAAKGSGSTTTTPTKTEGDVPNTLGLYDTTDRPLAPGRWTTLTVERADFLAGATAYSATVMLTVTGAPAGGTFQGRFYHLRPDGSRWDAGIVERPATAGSSFVDFPHMGSIDDAEKLRFEIAYFPAGDDTKSCTITTARVRGLYWK